jgi:signal transduction histidine kinase
MTLQTAKLAFKPRARLLLLLGDQLIRDPGIAVFELVKNAYDADSPNAIVTMTKVEDREEGKIVVEDSGVGMDFETVTKVWLEPGTDFRAQQKGQSRRTTIFGRLPMGEKGVGRFAAHKLGNHIRMVTRSAGNPEVVVDIDWNAFQSGGYLSDVRVTVEERDPKRFVGKKTGTRLQITQLRSAWNKAMVRDLHRSVTSICSPFTTRETEFDLRLKIEDQEDIKGGFEAELLLPEEEKWLEGLLLVDKVLDFSLFRARCLVHGATLKYDYRFLPFPAMTKVKKRHQEKGLDDRPMTVSFTDDDYPRLLEEYVGPFCTDLYIFDRDPQVLSLGVSDKKGLKEFLDESGGVRVYRDGIRVYDYGEPGNDWLNLDKRRVNIPSARISNNLVVGGVFLSLKSSSGITVARKEEDETEASLGLIEKTNREGFVENSTFRAFSEALNFAIAQIVSERNKDKERIRSSYSSKQFREPVLADLGELRSQIERAGLPEEVIRYVDRIERDYRDVRDRLLTSASAGLSLMVVIHEVEKGIAELLRAVEREHSSEKLVSLAQHISKLVEGLGAIARGSGTSRQRASELIRIAQFNTELRLEAHGIELLTDLERDFEAKCSKRLIISTLMNLIDNAIWWIDNRWGRDQRGKRKKLFIGTTDQLREPAIVVADNGSGFSDPREYLVQPFFTRKPDGMGLGLHLADQVMTLQGGRLEFPERGDIELPKSLDGAVVALVFGGAKWKA